MAQQLFLALDRRKQMMHDTSITLKNHERIEGIQLVIDHTSVDVLAMKIGINNAT